MSLHTDAVSADTGAMPTVHMSLSEITASIVPVLIGMVGVALVAVLMLL